MVINIIEGACILVYFFSLAMIIFNNYYIIKALRFLQMHQIRGSFIMRKQKSHKYIISKERCPLLIKIMEYNFRNKTYNPKV